MAKKKKTGLGYLFWFAFVLLVIFLYLASYKIAGDKIKNFKITDIFKNRVKSDTLEVVMNIEEENDERNVSDPPGQDESNNLPFSETEIIESQKDNETVTQGLTPPDNEDETMRHPDADNVGNPITEQESQDIKTRKANLFFYKLNAEGNPVELVHIPRQVNFSDAPLTETINQLLQGPDSSEHNQGIITLIPPESVLIKAYVIDEVAYLDFSENFRFNSHGNEGLKSQLRQVIYTATEFHNVKKVQILIEGEKINYLSQDGIIVNAPISKNYF